MKKYQCRMDKDDHWTLDLITDTFFYKLSGGLVMINCCLFLMFEE